MSVSIQQLVDSTAKLLAGGLLRKVGQDIPENLRGFADFLRKKVFIGLDIKALSDDVEFLKTELQRILEDNANLKSELEQQLSSLRNINQNRLHKPIFNWSGSN